MINISSALRGIFITQLSCLSSLSSLFFPLYPFLALFLFPWKKGTKQKTNKQKHFHFCKQSYSVQFSIASTSNFAQDLLFYSKRFSLNFEITVYDFTKCDMWFLKQQSQHFLEAVRNLDFSGPTESYLKLFGWIPVICIFTGDWESLRTLLKKTDDKQMIRYIMKRWVLWRKLSRKRGYM